jgi:hypothetical protein
MGKSSTQKTTQEQRLDPLTEQYRKMALEAAGAAAGYKQAPDPHAAERAAWTEAAKRPGVAGAMARKKLSEMPPAPGMVPGDGPVWNDPYTDQALSNYQGLANFGRLGTQALGGDADAMGRFMNPYQDQVLDQVTKQYEQARVGARMETDDAATRARAFGGSRHGVALAKRQAELDRTEQAQKAGLISAGFSDAQNRAMAAAQMGASAGGPLASLGQYKQMMSDPNLRRLQILQGAVSGMPYGSSTTMYQPVNSNFGSQLMGAGLIGAGLFTGNPAAMSAGASVYGGR